MTFEEENRWHEVMMEKKKMTIDEAIDAAEERVSSAIALHAEYKEEVKLSEFEEVRWSAILSERKAALATLRKLKDDS